MSGNTCEVTIKVLFFAKAREVAGTNEALVQVAQIIKGSDLLDLIVNEFGLDSIRKNVVLALNENWVDLDVSLKLSNADEIAIVPPLSGEYGAVTLFIGTTRNNFEGKLVERLEYEAYEKMAVKSLESVCKNIRNKYEVGNIAIFHRLGDVPVKEASVVVAISATHRQHVFEAASYAINALKADVPIWKKEVYEGDNAPQWKENVECAWSTNDFRQQITNTSDLLQLREEVVEADHVDNVSPDLIQINTSLQEINRRILSFIERKRHQVNVSNVEDFCVQKSNDDEDASTCARINAVLFRRKDTKTHLKVHKVENLTGPQIKIPEHGVKRRYQESSMDPRSCPVGAEERLINAESYLNIKNDSLNVFSRLKAIEDKILFLESISPEYFDIARQTKPEEKSYLNPVSKKKYTSEDIDFKLQQLKTKFEGK